MSSLRRRPTAALASVVAVSLTSVLTLAACGASSSGGGSGAAVVAYSASDRKALPALSGATLDGSTLDVAAMKGKVVVLNVWGSWCGPCQEEAPALEQVYETAKSTGRDVAFVGINTRDQVAQAKAFVKDNQISFANLVDGDDEKVLRYLVGIVSVTTVPATIIVDRNGKIAWRSLAKIDQKTLQAALDPVLAEK